MPPFTVNLLRSHIHVHVRFAVCNINIFQVNKWSIVNILLKTPPQFENLLTWWMVFRFRPISAEIHIQISSSQLTPTHWVTTWISPLSFHCVRQSWSIAARLVYIQIYEHSQRFCKLCCSNWIRTHLKYDPKGIRSEFWLHVMDISYGLV